MKQVGEVYVTDLSKGCNYGPFKTDMSAYNYARKNNIINYKVWMVTKYGEIPV